MSDHPPAPHENEETKPPCPWCRCRICHCSAMWGPKGSGTAPQKTASIAAHLAGCDICRNALVFCAAANDGGLLAIVASHDPQVDVKALLMAASKDATE